MPWATVEVVWGLGGSALGVTAAEWHTNVEQTSTSGRSRVLERAGVDTTVLASLVGVVLAVVLLSRPRLPRWLLLTPAVTGATSPTLYGVPLTIWARWSSPAWCGRPVIRPRSPRPDRPG